MEERAHRRVAVCRGPHCSAHGSAALARLLDEEIEAQGLSDRVETRPGACNKLCDFAPSMVVHPDKVWYAELTPAAIRTIVREHLGAGRPVRRWLMRDLGAARESVSSQLDDLFRQLRF